VFHSRAAATSKARSPMVERRVRGTTSDDVDAKRRRDADEPRQLMTGGITKRGTAELSGVGICTPEQPA